MKVIIQNLCARMRVRQKVRIQKVFQFGSKCYVKQLMKGGKQVIAQFKKYAFVILPNTKSFWLFN